MSTGRPMALWAPVVLWMALIFGLSSIAHPPDVPGSDIPYFDKYIHLLLYGGLSALCIRARTRRWSRPITVGVAVSAVLISTVYGLTDEWHQYFVPPRQADLFDVVADAIGAALAAGLLSAGIIRKRHDL